MAGGAPGTGVIQLVAAYTPLHFDGLLQLYDFLFRDRPVAGITLDLALGMRAMAEKDEVRQLVDPLERNLPLPHVGVAGAALCCCGKSGAIPLLGVLVARDALQLESCVLFMIERFVGSNSCKGDQGSAKATSESEYLSLYLLPPPAAITTYCFFVFFE